MLPSERELMREFGVSRLACREALAKMQGMGILKARHGKGVYLTDIRSMSVNPAVLRLLQVYGDISNANVLQARLIIEPPSAGAASGNPVFPMLLKDIHELLWRVRFEVLIIKPDITSRALVDHRKIAAAIAEGDSKEAEEAMERHIRLRGRELLQDEAEL